MCRCPVSTSWLLLLLVAPATLGDEPGVKVRTLKGHGGSVMAVAFSPDGKVLVTSSRDSTILPVTPSILPIRSPKAKARKQSPITTTMTISRAASQSGR